MPRKSRTALAAEFLQSCFVSDAAELAASGSAAHALKTVPFGRDAFGRVLSFIARNFGFRRRSRASSPMEAARRASADVAKALIFAHAAFILTSLFCLFLFRTVNPGATTLMAYRAVANGWTVAAPRFVPLAKIPKLTRTMTVRVEDGNFYEHRGIEPAAIKHAYELNKNLRTPLYGGSTITMQTARTIFLIPEKSYLRKYLEAIIALEMEAVLGKDRILELYFNYAEWGKGVFGIEAASRRHYKRGVASLTRDQAMRLVTLLSSPIRFTPYDFGRNGILISRYAYLVKRWGDPPPVAPPASEPSASIGG